MHIPTYKTENILHYNSVSHLLLYAIQKDPGACAERRLNLSTMGISSANR